MKILITYYSRTNITKKVAETIQKNLDCDIEEIIDLKNRSGIFGWIKSCVDAIRGKETKIKPLGKDPSDYDLVIIGTPVWASTMSSATLTYLKENKEKFKEVSFFCTCGSGGYEETFSKMEEIAGKAIETLFITKEDLDSSLESKIQSYAEKFKES
ncbi:MAG: flavodoxin [Methanobrevibacter sp.]|nr:flavodoxin [Methanobrevibacter sp.]